MPKQPSNREQIILQLQQAGFAAETFPDSTLALLAALAGLRGDLQEIQDSIDTMGAMLEDCLAEEKENE